MKVAKYIRDEMKAMKRPKSGKPFFTFLDNGDDNCLPVVACRLNPELNLPYDDIDLQHALAGGHWYVSGYKMSFHDVAKDDQEEPLFSDQDKDETMFRIVVKSNLTMPMAQNLISTMDAALKFLENHGEGYNQSHGGRQGKHAAC